MRSKKAREEIKEPEKHDRRKYGELLRQIGKDARKAVAGNYADLKTDDAFLKRWIWLAGIYLVLQFGMCAWFVYLWVLLEHYPYYEWPLPLWETAYRLQLPFTKILVKGQCGERWRNIHYR